MHLHVDKFACGFSVEIMLNNSTDLAASRVMSQSRLTWAETKHNSAAYLKDVRNNLTITLYCISSLSSQPCCIRFKLDIQNECERIMHLNV